LMLFRSFKSIDLYITRPGLFYGQCSELRGVNHGFMPILVHAHNFHDFLRDFGKLTKLR